MRNRGAIAVMGWAFGMASLGLGLDDPGARSETPSALETPSGRKPVMAGAAFDSPKVRPGSTVTLVVRARLAPTWHIYAADEPASGSIPTTLKLRLPRGIEPVGNWSYPDATPNPAGEGLVYEGELTFRRTLKVARNMPPGPVEVTCQFGYQACDASSCRPPARLNLKAKVEVAARR